MEGLVAACGGPSSGEAGLSTRFRAAELDRHIGQRLRFVRRLAGWSQRELGSRIGLTFQQVQKYENGCNRISAALLAELANLFELPLGWFVGPYGGATVRQWPDAEDTYPALLEILFRQDDGRDEAVRSTGLSTILQFVPGQIATGEDGRLAALRRALQASTPGDRTFLLEAARRVVEQAQPPLPVAAPAGVVAGGAANVLLVDDDPDIVATLSAALENAGFEVTTASSGDLALSMLATGLATDVLVTDYAMVGMDGVELLAQAALQRPGLPGLVITGFADSDRLNDLPSSVEVLRKPFRRMELIGRLRLLLGRQRLGAGLGAGASAP